MFFVVFVKIGRERNEGNDCTISDSFTEWDGMILFLLGGAGGCFLNIIALIKFLKPLRNAVKSVQGMIENDPVSPPSTLKMWWNFSEKKRFLDLRRNYITHTFEKISLNVALSLISLVGLQVEFDSGQQLVL